MRVLTLTAPPCDKQYVVWVVVVWGGLEVVSYLIDNVPGVLKLKQIRIRPVPATPLTPQPAFARP